MKKILHLFKCNKGNALISVMGVTLGAVMLTAMLMTYQSTIAIADKVKDNGQLMLDAYTIKTGKEIVSQIKSGNDYTRLLNENRFLKDYYTAMGIDSSFDSMRDGRLLFKMSDIETSFIFDKALKTEVTYDITLPLYFIGIKTFDVKLQVRLQSRYNLYIE